MNLSYKTKYIHLFFISLLAIHYVIPLIFIGQVVVIPHDVLDIAVVFDHIISKIYKGDLESINYFLSGKIKWFYLEELFYPINILHYFLDDKLFYFTNDILRKLFAYFSFYILAKSLYISKFNSALGGILYSTLVYIKVPVGLGIVFFPYILYLLINKKSLIKKHYLSLKLPTKIKKFFKKKKINKIISFMKKDKKNLNEKINLILIKKIGKTTQPNSFAVNSSEIKKFLAAQYI